MKIAVQLVALCFAYVALVQANKGSPMRRVLMHAYRNCRDTLNADAGTLKLVRAEEGLDDEKANCVRACIMKEVGLLQDSKFDFSRLRELLNSGKHADSEKTESMIEEAQKCQPDAEASDDECTVAGKYVKCFHDLKVPSKPSDEDYAEE